MKRALLGTLWIGAIAAGLAIALQISGLLARPAAALGKAIGLSPNEAVGFWNFLFLILLSFTVAWTMLQVTGVARRAGLFALLILELLGAAWVLHAARCFLPAVAGHSRCHRRDSPRAWSERDTGEPSALGHGTGFCRPSRADRHRSSNGK